MRSKTPLVLMEQIIMVLIFALSAVVYIKVFVYSNNVSKSVEAASHAAFKAQTMAEELKFSSGESLERWHFDNDSWYIYYDENWQETAEESEYTMKATKEYEENGLCRVSLRVSDNKEVLFEIPVAWQEVTADE